MTPILAFLLICTTPTEISSSHASYDGSGLILKGKVVLDHGLGTMEAEEARLQKQEEGQTFPFSLIHLEKKVFLKLHDNAELHCDTADLDFSTLSGALTSSSHVIYTDTVKKVQLLGKTIDLQFLKKAESSYDIQNILARGDVEVTYADGYILTTDAVSYQKESIASHGKGKLVHQTDTIEADRFDLDLASNKLIMQNPQGTIPSLSIETLTTQEIHLFQKDNQLTGFKSFGKTTLAYLNKHHLISHGTLTLDKTQHSGTVESPLIDGAVPEGLQLYYEEGEMGVLADKASIEYTEELNPVSVALKGHVKIFSHSHDRCGIADRLVYNPTTRTFILGADPGKKVIFVNDKENLRISAQEVHITQDPATKKQIVKGIGNVQLALTSEEELTLNKHFNHATP